MSSCTLFANEAPAGSGFSLEQSSTADIDHTIISFGAVGESIVCDGASHARVRCTDIFANAGGDWVGCIAALHGVDGNIEADPLFCNIGFNDLRPADASPCPPANSGGCGLIGAIGGGCVSAVQASTWGQIKSGFAR